MKGLSAMQLDDVLSRLPPVENYKPEFIKLPIRLRTTDVNSENYFSCCPVGSCEFIEFVKSEDGAEWHLASMPEL